ncbi:nuclear transport factor 2 family protein [Streptomyces sp. NPDC051217]|uniref:nuclear transport factor 2 family protein n=1 Tax=Streptomyces sp. NPDC051217 TaxID=3365644 RepID=UPI0037B09BEC
MRVQRFKKLAGQRSMRVGAAAAVILAGGGTAVAVASQSANASPAHVRSHESASTAATVRELTDVHDIEQLKAGYFRDIDTKQWAELQARFTPDAHINTGQQFNSPAALVKASKALIGDAPTAHQGFLPEITVNGDVATGTWAMEDYVNLKAGGGFHGYGEYHDTYKRVHGHWYISGSDLTRFRLDTLPDQSASPKG